MTFYLVCYRCRIAYPFSCPVHRTYTCHLCGSELKQLEIDDEDNLSEDEDLFLIDADYRFPVRISRKHPSWRRIFDQGNSVNSWMERN